MDRRKWVLLAYRLPREPSTPRIALWRKFKRLGVAQLLDGLVALPFDRETREQLEWAGQEILDAGGEATIWIGELGSAKDERILVDRMREAVGEEYEAVSMEAAAARRHSDADRARTLARLRRELRRIGQRDYFPPPQRERATQAVERLASLAEVRT
ncbi:MAG TPA: Chromate resistance protein ChrB [Actinomycetota bacterium]|nr:Chromate resistance protein ChrB [Actinomycetota bacterium]